MHCSIASASNWNWIEVWNSFKLKGELKVSRSALIKTGKSANGNSAFFSSLECFTKTCAARCFQCLLLCCQDQAYILLFALRLNNIRFALAYFLTLKTRLERVNTLLCNWIKCRIKLIPITDTSSMNLLLKLERQEWKKCACKLHNICFDTQVNNEISTSEAVGWGKLLKRSLRLYNFTLPSINFNCKHQ